MKKIKVNDDNVIGLRGEERRKELGSVAIICFYRYHSKYGYKESFLRTIIKYESSEQSCAIPISRSHEPKHKTKTICREAIL